MTQIDPTFVDGTGGGDTIVITGSGFAGATQVWFDDQAAASFNIDSDTQITAVTPAQNLTASSMVGVFVEDADGRSSPGAVDSTYLTLGNPPEAAPPEQAGEPPVVMQVDPTFVDGTGGGDTIVITGSGFTGATQVWFGDQAAASFNIDSDTQITAVTPAQNLTSSSMVGVLVDGAGGRSAPGAVDSTYLTLGNPPQ